MSVYVDKLRNWGWRLGPSCHLTADTNEELHSFAKRLGLKREWFQAATSGPHYDLTARKRILALRYGAIEQTDREMVDKMNEWRDMALAKLKACKTEKERNKVREWLYR